MVETLLEQFKLRFQEQLVCLRCGSIFLEKVAVCRKCGADGVICPRIVQIRKNR